MHHTKILINKHFQVIKFNGLSNCICKEWNKMDHIINFEWKRDEKPIKFFYSFDCLYSFVFVLEKWEIVLICHSALWLYTLYFHKYVVGPIHICTEWNKYPQEKHECQNKYQCISSISRPVRTQKWFIEIKYKYF